ncbi:MAG: hypothetical protein JJ863_13580 [Deltaproteobacteria bacterium]|nr:hypothetical protein [Deltaproteobacteria bacterium]
MTVAQMRGRALLIAAALVGCGTSQAASTPTAEEEARVAAREVASRRFPDCSEVRVTLVREEAHCVEDTPVERWAMDENGDCVGDGCARWESLGVPPGHLWAAEGCGRHELIYCGGCDGSMSTCYDHRQIGLRDCPTAARARTTM